MPSAPPTSYRPSDVLCRCVVVRAWVGRQVAGGGSLACRRAPGLSLYCRASFIGRPCAASAKRPGLHGTLAGPGHGARTPARPDCLSIIVGAAARGCASRTSPDCCTVRSVHLPISGFSAAACCCCIRPAPARPRINTSRGGSTCQRQRHRALTDFQAIGQAVSQPLTDCPAAPARLACLGQPS
jgi:hypothetical protein